MSTFFEIKCMSLFFAAVNQNSLCLLQPAIILVAHLTDELKYFVKVTFSPRERTR